MANIPIYREAEPHSTSYAVNGQPLCHLGEFSYALLNIAIWDQPGRLSIGKFCSIAEGADFMLGGPHATHQLTTYPFAEIVPPGCVWPEAWPFKLPVAADKQTIRVGNDVWIGRKAMILFGVTIGDGAIVGAGSVVARNVPPYSIVTGNPARLVRMRFSAEEIETLLRVQWWDWPVDRIRRNIAGLLSADVEALESRVDVVLAPDLT